MKIMKCLEECEKQGEVKIAEAKEERKKKEKKPKKKRMIETKKVAEEWKIWNEKKEATKSEEKAKKLVSQRFYKQIYIFKKKTSERMAIKKVWDYAIELKKKFISRKEKIYSLLRKKREKVYKFIKE